MESKQRLLAILIRKTALARDKCPRLAPYTHSVKTTPAVTNFAYRILCCQMFYIFLYFVDICALMHVVLHGT